MTQPTRTLLSSLLILFVCAACSKTASNSASEAPTAPSSSPATERITSESVVKAAGLPVEISAGATSEAIVRLTIQNGYHVNANPPTYPYLKATTLDVAAGDGISVTAMSYPKALEKKFPFAEQPLAVYEGETDVKATLKADQATKKGERSIPARLRIQACDDQVCYAPGTIDVNIPVRIK